MSRRITLVLEPLTEDNDRVEGFIEKIEDLAGAGIGIEIATEPFVILGVMAESLTQPVPTRWDKG